MRYRLGFAVLAALLAAGCTTTSHSPATAPPTSIPASAPSTTGLVTDTTNGRADPTTSTAPDRIAVLTATINAIEESRIEALYERDLETFQSLHADTPFREESLRAFEAVEAGTPPTISVSVLEILRDDAECLALWIATTVNGQEASPVRIVLTPAEAEWRIAFIGSERSGWMCDGPHPLSP